MDDADAKQASGLTVGANGHLYTVSGSTGATMMRTAPLWEIGVHTTYLHDGRARSIADAIIMHDGQGRASAEAFQNLPTRDKKALLLFVKSL